MRVFVPGFGARAALYYGLTESWTIHQPPSLRVAPTFADHVAELCHTVRSAPAPVILGGHSLGAAIAVATANRCPGKIERLVLVAPAGLPLVKTKTASLRDFCRQSAAGAFPIPELIGAISDALRAPRRAYRLACAAHRLDLRAELETLGASGVPCDVIGCTSDTLTPVAHCREIARLAGAAFTTVQARSGHNWPIIEPYAFPAGLLL